ncbi:MAG: signal peptidase I [Gemmatimonadota bacterium]
MRDSETAAQEAQRAGPDRVTGRFGAIGRGIADWLRSVVVALLVFLVIRAWGVEAFKIPTGSMEGTLLVGDFLLVNKAVYGTTLPGLDLRIPGFAEPGWGDVVVFHPPHEPDKNYVKRIVGLPRDTIEMRDKQLFRNGAAIAEPYARYVDRRGDAMHPDMQWQSNHLIASTRRRYEPTRDNWGPIVVPTGRYFVLGDNRDNSEDSRYWGFVARDRIRGKPWRVYYSFDPVPESRFAWLQTIRWNRLGAPIR